MDSNIERNVGRSQPVSESVSLPAPRELEPTPVPTRSADVNRAEMTSSMVLRWHVRESRSSADKPEPEVRPEVVSRPEMELTAESEIPVPTSVRRGFWATGLYTAILVYGAEVGSDADSVAEIVLTFPLPARPEMHLHVENLEINQNPSFHTYCQSIEAMLISQLRTS